VIARVRCTGTLEWTGRGWLKWICKHRGDEADKRAFQSDVGPGMDGDLLRPAALFSAGGHAHHARLQCGATGKRAVDAFVAAGLAPKQTGSAAFAAGIKLGLPPHGPHSSPHN
jgi:hypothetical protein